MKNPDCIIVNPGTPFHLDFRYFQEFENLRVVGTPSTGVNHIDKQYLESRNIRIFCLLDNKESLENIHASAEFTWIHIMNGFRKFIPAVQHIYEWRSESNESFLRSHELADKKIGIIGLGRIGRKIAKYAKAFSMNIFYYDPYVITNQYTRVNHISELKECDVISINPYLTQETKEIITWGVFDGFKQDLIIVNTSRGEVVNEDYIYHLIKEERIIYSCDVMQNEQQYDVLRRSTLFNLKSNRLTITPHIAGATVESQYKALKAILHLCHSYLSSTTA